MSQDRSFSLAVIDMAGTTVNEGALQEQAFARALAAHGVLAGTDAFAAMTAQARRTMGTSKELVFRHLFGDALTAADANRTFEAAYDSLLERHGVEPIPGAEAAILDLRERGLKICLATGFGRHTQNMILESLGWMGLADLSLCPSDAGRGRPYPDIILTAVLALDIEDVRSVVVAGDTTSDVLAGRRAGAGAVVGVLTGAHSEAELQLAGADVVLPSMCHLPQWLDSGSPAGSGEIGAEAAARH
ncbi:HAD family hydrolase [Arthrobacter agilis]|uniref:HAD family hydrolase n=1 Tax=Arthrobacter agilis TaxID=37921 RepID=UPI000B35CBA5|nr:HAD family hydrolase [Arthrobacter agilis]OUM43755.1 haloacid dehalogenase [Arthrobacter agilis]PPB46659.1 haloacid dehalogenase [Arthrobacter agilis]TPV24997.1 HAD family hydrolase [Arthrobacter agilis]VDR31177.1 Phosphonoacetaldehyde hydrolase [Arthrobacter agilis]